MKETMFRGSQPARLNACVGDNGFVSYFEYAEGFSLAANALLDKVIEDKGIHTSPDYFIYPICFNMRHSIELRLKGAIEELVKVADSVGKTLIHEKYSITTEENKINIIYVHNIKAIWDFFKKNALEIDERYQFILNNLETHILDIAEIDPTGQTFRYPISKQSKKHLTDVGGLISCQILKMEFKELHKNLDILFHFTRELQEEYHLSSVDDGISRLTLYLIAQEFSNIKSSEDFKNTKVETRKKFNISNRKLDSALKRITEHYEFSSIVQEKNELLGITENQLIEVIQYWINQNPEIFKTQESELVIFSARDIDFDQMILEREEQKSMMEDLKDKLSVEYAAGLHALFYFSRDGIDYSERYRDFYEYELQSKAPKDSFLHVFEKANLLEMTLVSLCYLGFKDIAEKLIKKFDLNASYLDIPKIMDVTSYCRKLHVDTYTNKYLEML